MKLIDLNPSWVGYGGDGVTQNGQPVPHRDRIGVNMNCPCGCTHRLFVPFANPADGLGPVLADRPLWQRNGETFEDLTLSPSIQRVVPCTWHGFIENGSVRNA